MRALGAPANAVSPARQPASPSGERSAGRPVWSAIAEGVGEVACLGQMPPRGLQIEAQAVRRQHRIAAPPGRVPHRAGGAGLDRVRARRRAGLVPDAADRQNGPDHTPLLGRHTTMSAMPSPSKSAPPNWMSPFAPHWRVKTSDSRVSIYQTPSLGRQTANSCALPIVLQATSSQQN